MPRIGCRKTRLDSTTCTQKPRISTHCRRQSVQLYTRSCDTGVLDNGLCSWVGGARDEIGDVAPTVCVYQYTSLHHIKSKKWGCPTLEGLYSAPTLEYPRRHPTTPCSWINALQRLKYNFNKYLAIANRSRVSCTYNTLRAFIGLNITP